MKIKYHIPFDDLLLFVLIQMMMLTQTVFMEIKLAIILVIAFINLIKKRYDPSRYNFIVFGILFLILFNGFYRISTAILANTMDFQELLTHIPFHIINPILFYLLIPSFISNGGIRKVCNYLVCGHFFIILMGFYNLLAVFLGYTPIQFLADEKYVVTERGISFSASGTYQMFVTLPIFCTLGFSKVLSNKLFIIGAILSIIYVVLCGSSAMIVIGICSLFIPLALKKIDPKNNAFSVNLKKVTIVIACFIIFGYIQFADKPFMEIAYQEFLDHFDSDTDIRFEQRRVLLEAWEQAPIFGHGYGSSFTTKADGRIKSFESMYHSLLATNGIVGLLLYLSHVFLIIFNLYKKIKKNLNPYEAGVLFAYLAMLLCSATNPALASFDRLLIIYICISCLATKDKNGQISPYNKTLNQ